MTENGLQRVPFNTSSAFSLTYLIKIVFHEMPFVLDDFSFE